MVTRLAVMCSGSGLDRGGAGLCPREFSGCYKNRVCIGCEGIGWSLHRLRRIGQRTADTADRGGAADCDEDGFRAVSGIDQSASRGLPRWR
uniref:Uncharacterized protein n=1 Tax=Oryza sativa subsp. japonica TaxID=39947 RepID=Q84T39_ORYSJ|nr:hypothetical protein [Oryza sativa Japonica Group]